jgi:hypothetical protein
MWIDVHTPLHPRKIRSISFNKLKDVRMVKVKMAHDSAVLVNTPASEYFIQG